MTTFKSGINGALYIDGTLLEFVGELSWSIDRDNAEASLMGQEYKIKRVGPYGGEFSGSGLVDMDTKVLLDEVLAQSTTTAVVAIYPDRTDTTTGWYWNGQFSSYSASATAGELWTTEFSGIVCDVVSSLGFT